jgi:type II secretory pathway component GspD/PulD (secretin)
MLNALIVRASPTDVTAIQAVVDKLDIPEAAKASNFRLVKVAATLNVIDLADTVQTSVNEGARMSYPPGRDQLVPAITVIPDRRIHAVVLAGSESLFEQAESLIREMEKTSGTAELDTRILTIRNRQTDDIVRLIERLKGESSSTGRSKRSSGSTSKRSSTPTRSRRR